MNKETKNTIEFEDIKQFLDKDIVEAFEEEFREVDEFHPMLPANYYITPSALVASIIQLTRNINDLRK